MSIREEELRDAHGLVIFSLARTGLSLFSPTIGSGVVVARLPDGSWSPPAAIGIVSINLFFVPLSFGLDLVEAVLVLPTRESVDTFKDQCRFSLGAAAGMTLGPWGAGGGAEFLSNTSLYKDFPKLYTRSRGLFFSLAMEGRFIAPRTAASELFYGKEGITANDILSGKVPAKGPKGMWYVLTGFP
jgi:SH3 domain-containing YSC84-like protein 1